MRTFLPLYLSRALAAWGDRTWQFMGGLFMLKLDGSQSLRLVAVYGLVSCLALLVLGNALGRLVDVRARDNMVKAAVITQNITVSVTSAILAVHFSGILPPSPALTLCLSGTAIFLYTLSYLASVAARISVEKDWIVVLCEEDSGRLAEVNTNVRTIDLVCNLLAPILAGFLVQHCSYFAAALILVFWVLMSATLELLLLMHIFKRNPILASKETNTVETEGGEGEEDEEGASASSPWFYKNFAGWRTYFRHPVRDSGLGLAMLYMTVLGFDNITWGFCRYQGVSESVLGTLTALSALVGVTGARVFPLLAGKIGLTATGLLGFAIQSCCLAFSVASVWAPGSPFSLSAPDSPSHLETSNHDQFVPSNQYNIVWRTQDNLTTDTTNLTTDITETSSISAGNSYSYISVTLLLVGIISSRFGLWIADLTVHQIFQEEIEEEERGAVCGVQAGLQSLMDLIKFVLVFFIPHQNTFGILIILSYLFVTSGGVLFFKYKLESVESGQGETDKLISK